MNSRWSSVVVLLGMMLSGPAAPGVAAAAGGAGADLSFRNEIQHAIDRGLSWLQRHQNTNGWWTTPDHPALTALVLAAHLSEPTGRYRSARPPWLAAGRAHLLASVRSEGSIHRVGLANYNTALSVVALVLWNEPADEKVLRDARAFLIHSQVDLGEKGRVDTALDGGVGYGDKYAHSDLNNTLMALEAIRATDYLARDRGSDPEGTLDWDAAIRFIQNCQNLPSHNPQPWVSGDARDRGGFVYYPGHSMAGGLTNAVTGRISLRSYGSISYAGLLSYLYADLKPNDPRVVGVMDWLRANYTLDENPGMGPQGLYYYLHLLTKALQVSGLEQLELSDGRRLEWPRVVAQRWLDLQRADGSWANEDNRWWEKDPCLVTAYAVLSLNRLWREFTPPPADDASGRK